MIDKNKNINIRVSPSELEAIKRKATSCGINYSIFIRIATELVKEDDITQYLLDKIKEKHKV